MTRHALSSSAVEIAPAIQRVTASNAGPMTGPGTNTYIIGHDPAIVVDPAIDDPAHFDAVETAAGRVAAIWLTHRHPDHAGGAAAFAQRTGAPLRAWPQTQLGRFDIDIAIDQPLADGERVEWGPVTLQAIHTPGHAADHLCFVLEPAQIVLAGDLMMTDSSVVILPPEGRMTDYLNSLRTLRALPLAGIAPAHGELMTQPTKAIDSVINHRIRREAEVLGCLSPYEPQSVAAITKQLYPELSGDLRQAAGAQVWAHLIRLDELSRAHSDDAGWYAAAATG